MIERARARRRTLPYNRICSIGAGWVPGVFSFSQAVSCVPVPPESVEILSENGQLADAVVGAYEEGQTLRLTCRIRGGERDSAADLSHQRR